MSGQNDGIYNRVKCKGCGRMCMVIDLWQNGECTDCNLNTIDKTFKKPREVKEAEKEVTNA